LAQNTKDPSISISTRLASDIDYQKLIDNHPDMLCQWLKDGTLILANKAYCEYFGKQMNDLVGKTCLDYIHPDDQEKLKQHNARFNSEFTQAIIELKIINPKGEIRYHQWNDIYIFNEKRNRWEFLSTGRDVTELKLAEFELQKRVEFERLITKHTIEFINLSLFDIDHRITNLLSEIGEYANVDRAYVFLFDDNLGCLTNTHEWCRQGIEPQIQNLQCVPADSIYWWVKKIKNFETVLIPQISSLPPEADSFKASLKAQDILSVAGTPLVNAGQILGFIGFDAVSVEKNWMEDDITILRLISGIIGGAIAQKRSQEAFSEERRYLQSLNEITRDSLNSDNIQEMLDIIAEKSKTLIKADYCSINLWDEEHKIISTSARNGEFLRNMDGSFLQMEETTITNQVFQTGDLLIIEDTRNTLHPSIIKAFGTESLLAIPIVTNDNQMGAAIFGYTKQHTFTEHEIQLAQQASSQIAMAILKQRLLDQAKRSAREAETLHKAGTIVAATLEPNLAIESILDQLEMVVPFDSASVQILHDGYLEIRAGKGWAKKNSPVGLKFPVPGDNPNSKVILSKEPFVLNNAPDFYEIFRDSIHSRIRSWLGVPLKVHDDVIGLLTLDHHEPNYYSNKQLITLASAFADQVAISLENSRLYAAEKRRVQELDALRATTADITKELAIENLIQAILERATSLLHATGGELGLVDPNGELIHIHVSHNMGANKVGVVIEPGEGLMGYVAKTRQIEMIEDYQEWIGKLDIYKQSNIHAAIAAPLMIGSHFLGVIGIMNSDRKRKFTDSEKSLMSQFAQQAAIAVQNAQLFEERKQQARIDLTTGIYNRRGLNELGIREIDRSQRFDRPLSLLMVDIDHFKRVNDTYGHPIGDLVLKELADRLKNHLRSIDILSRYGGEEFVIILPETATDHATEVAERLREVVEQKPFTPDGLALPITISLGISTLNGDALDIQTLIKNADDAMYVSKRSGRNQVNVFPKTNQNPS
jgi:diguanylate cyclase (GGDEF)-like protein/PAS domain S-box-containing protein